jgi:hypothetical protein
MKHQFKSNQEFYDHIDVLCVGLREAGCADEADRLWGLIHQVAWTTSTELLAHQGHGECREEDHRLRPHARNPVARRQC